MIKKISLILIILFISTLLSFSQVNMKGGIEGVVVDENDEPLPGVTVTLTGEKLFQRSLSTVATVKGIFRFYNLNPGTYDLEFSLTGFNTQKIVDVNVNVGKTTTVKAILKYAKIKEEVDVIAEAPLIETKTSQVSTTFTTQKLENLPTSSRHVLDLIDAVPGINDKGAYGAGANYDSRPWGETGTSLSYAQGSITSTIRLNGVDVSNLDSGNTFANPNYDTIEEVQVIGIGATAEYGQFTGATVNIVTKSGSNKFRGGLSFYYSDSNLRGDNSGGIEDLRPGDLKYNPEFTGYLGGPIIKEKLFFFMAAGYKTRKHKIFGAPDYDILKQPNFQIKFDWVLNNKNTITAMINTDPLEQENLGLRPGSGPEIAMNKILGITTWYGAWQSILSERTLLNIKYAGFTGKYNDTPVSPDASSFTNYGTGRQYRSYGFFENRKPLRHEGHISLTQYADDFLNASHEFKFGVEYARSSWDDKYGQTGEAMMWAFPYGNYLGVTALTNYQVHTIVKSERISAYVQDNILIGSNITLNLGIRYDNPKLIDPSVGTIHKFPSFSPRLGISYDITGDAKNVLHFHYGRYRNKLTSYAFSRALSRGITDWIYYELNVPLDFEYSESFVDEIVQPENYAYTIGMGEDPWEIEEGTKLPRTDVFNLGFEKQLWRDFVLSIDYIHKRDGDILMRDTRTQHTYQQEEWTDPWFGNTLTVWKQTDTLPDVWYHANSKIAKRRHHFLTISFRKRPVGNWSILASFTYQNSKGNADNSEGATQGLSYGVWDSNPNYSENPLEWGNLSWSRPYQFKLLATYLLPWGISISGDVRILSGNFFNPWIRSRTIGLGGNSRVTLIAQRGHWQHPSSEFFNLRLAKSFGIGDSSKIELIADILNVFNGDDGWWYYDYPWDVYPLAQEPAFGEPRFLIPPRNLRLGIRWIF